MPDNENQPDRTKRRKAVLRTAWILAGLVIIIYGYIILRGVINYYS